MPADPQDASASESLNLGTFFRRHCLIGLAAGVAVALAGFLAWNRIPQASTAHGVSVITGGEAAAKLSSISTTAVPINGSTTTPRLEVPSLIERQLLVRSNVPNASAAEQVRTALARQFSATRPGMEVDAVRCGESICEIVGRLTPRAGVPQDQEVAFLTGGVVQRIATGVGLDQPTETSINSDASGTLIFTLHGIKGN